MNAQRKNLYIASVIKVIFHNDKIYILSIFTRNAITKVCSGHTPMSGMLGNPMVHTKIMILLLFYKK